MHRLILLFTTFLIVLVTGCEQYRITINDSVVYTPQPLFSDFDIADDALATCIVATIEHQRITAATQLKELNCSYAGISDLRGLSTFGQLVIVRLSSNEIAGTDELSQLSLLRELYLDNNAIATVTTLAALSKLSYLDVRGNPRLECPENSLFTNVTTVLLPEHCSA